MCPSWDEELGNMERGDDGVDRIRLEWRRQLDWLKIYAGKAMGWIEVGYEEWVSKSQAPELIAFYSESSLRS